ncbi:acyl-CoA dehydrogenase family protein [Thermoactinospora rubra]|uniref:acyl-CoA dehydrogenase family protein n=1 Tax=Thermoactinospora rubra TaxID=1088767 RepID=UPI000A10CF5D|nr:acyl-CoA dehydrogenase family protein [Thermoactinospora rubra]
MTHADLRATVRSYLSARPAASWRAFAGDLGAAGLTVPEQYGGAACGLEEVAVVAEELGRALSPHPFLQTFLAVEALKHGGSAEATARLLPELAEGARSATVVFPGPLRLEGGRLSGVARHVLDGELVLAYAGGRLVEAAPTRRVPYRTMDESRPLSELTFERVPVRHVGTGTVWEHVRDLGVIALAAEQVGGAARCLETATAYAKVRVQFGRPIGAFQAVKHKLADVFVAVEAARSAALAAAADPSARTAAVAGSFCTEAYLTAAGESIQVHGGIGVTWEHEAHRYFKRATSDAQLFCPPQEHRTRLLQYL